MGGTATAAQSSPKGVSISTRDSDQLVHPRVADGSANIFLASRKRFEALTGLRALACLGVLVVHTAILFAVGNSVWQW